jgi:hypothetical protein
MEGKDQNEKSFGQNLREKSMAEVISRVSRKCEIAAQEGKFRVSIHFLDGPFLDATSPEFATLRAHFEDVDVHVSDPNDCEISFSWYTEKSISDANDVETEEEKGAFDRSLTLDENFVKAAAEGKFDWMVKYKKQGATDFNSALVAAAKRGDTMMCHTLVGWGATNVNEAYHVAGKMGYRFMVKFFKGLGAM